MHFSGSVPRSFILRSLLISNLGIFGQETNSTTVSRSIQVEIGVMPFDYAITPSMEQLQNLNPGEENLYRDFGKHEETGVYYIEAFPQEWYTEATYFRGFRSKPRLQWSVGLSYHQVFLGGRSFGFDTIIARDTFFNSQGEKIPSVAGLSEYVSFLTAGHELMFPVAVYWKGKSPKYIWAEAGIKASPGVIFSPTFRFVRHYSTYTHYELPGRNISAVEASISDSGSYESYRTPISALGLSMNLSLPITLYVRFSRTHRTFSRVHLFVNVTPFCRYSAFSGLPTQLYFQRSLSAGLRFRL